MSDKTDPRLDAAKGWVADDWERELRQEGIAFADDSLTERAVDMLADLDDADRRLHVVRVDTHDDALVERLAEAEREARASYWDATTPAERAATGVDGVSRHVARAVLAALREGVVSILSGGDKCDEFPCDVCAYRGAARCEERR